MKPGPDLSSLADQDVILRLGFESSLPEEVPASIFNLSSKEKNEKQKCEKCISAWETSLTSVEQARSFGRPDRRILVEMSVQEYRQAVANLTKDVDVLRDYLPDCLQPDETRYPQAKEGCEGHCGVRGLAKSKQIRKSLIDYVSNNKRWRLLLTGIPLAPAPRPAVGAKRLLNRHDLRTSTDPFNRQAVRKCQPSFALFENQPHP